MKRGQEEQKGMFFPSFLLQPFQEALFRGELIPEQLRLLNSSVQNPRFPVPPEGALHTAPPLHGLSQWEAHIYTCSTSLWNITNVVHSGLCFSANLWRRGTGTGANFRFWPRSIWCRARMTWLTVESSVGSIDIILHLTGYCSLNFEQESRSSKNTSGPKRKRPKQSLNKARKQEKHSP